MASDGLRLSVGVHADKNQRWRRTMEDAHVVINGFDTPERHAFFAVIDGHGGRQAAEYVERVLAERFMARLAEAVDDNVPAVFNSVFGKIDDELREQQILFPGCTIVVAYMRYVGPDVVLYTANLGDARAVLSRNGAPLRLSYDHKATDVNEQQRVTEAGAFIMRDRVNGTLAVTRALGDLPLKKFVVSRPYTTETTLKAGQDAFLILACDGIWDVFEDAEAVEHVAGIPDAIEASETLLKLALKRGSMDNITSMVVRFHWPGDDSAPRKADPPAEANGTDAGAETNSNSESS